MTATLKFNLPDEQEDFARACRAGAVQGLLHDLDNELRAYLKHGTPLEGLESPTTPEAVAFWVRRRLGDMTDD